jgi:hypothetical protein
MLSTVCIYLIALSSSFEWFRVSPPPITTFNRKKGKQAAKLNSYNGGRDIFLSLFIVLSFVRRLIFLIIATRHLPPVHKQEVIIHLCLPNYYR